MSFGNQLELKNFVTIDVLIKDFIHFTIVVDFIIAQYKPILFFFFCSFKAKSWTSTPLHICSFTTSWFSCSSPHYRCPLFLPATHTHCPKTSLLFNYPKRAHPPIDSSQCSKLLIFVHDLSSHPTSLGFQMNRIKFYVN